MINDNILILIIVMCFASGMVIGYLLGRRFPA